MAEFASAVIGLAAVGSKLVSGLSLLIEAFHDAPEEFYLLSIEKNDFQLLLESVKSIRQAKHLQVENQMGCSNIDALVRFGTKALEDVDRLVQKVTKTVEQAGNGRQMQRILWVRHVKKARRLLGNMRNLRSALQCVCIRETFQSTTRIGTTLDSLCPSAIDLKSSSPEGKLQDSKRQTRPKCQYLRNSSSQYGVCSSQQSHRRHSTLKTLPPILELNLKVIKETYFKKWSIPPTDRLQSSLLCIPPAGAGNRFLGVKRLECLQECRCRCHKNAVSISSRSLIPYLGTILFSCSNLPWCLSNFSQCDEQTCRRSKGFFTQFKYMFPIWFSFPFLQLQADVATQSFTLSFRMRTRNVIPFDSPIFQATRYGDAEAMKQLLLSGKASPYDVDPDGDSLFIYLIYCLGWKGEESCSRILEALESLGIATSSENFGLMPQPLSNLSYYLGSISKSPFDSTSAEKGNKVLNTTSQSLWIDVLDNTDFPILHRILLNLDSAHGTIHHYLSTFPKAGNLEEIINETCHLGGTPLAWAVLYGLPDAVATLLSFGADVRNVTTGTVFQRFENSGASLLHLAILVRGFEPTLASMYKEVVNLLLRAGADLNEKNIYGWTPLHLASWVNDCDAISLLREYGQTSLDLWAVTANGETAIDLARNNCCHEAMQYLESLLKENINVLGISGDNGQGVRDTGVGLTVLPSQQCARDESFRGRLLLLRGPGTKKAGVSDDLGFCSLRKILTTIKENRVSVVVSGAIFFSAVVCLLLFCLCFPHP